MSHHRGILRVIGMTITLRSTRRAIGLLMVLASAVKAQTTLLPMASVRLTTAAGQVAGRVVAADSNSVLLELPGGERRMFARADVTSIEQRGGRALRGAKILGITGAVSGALLGVLAVEGLCETSACEDDIPSAIALVGGIGGTIGVATGAFIGYNTSWRPLDHNFQVRKLDRISTCLLHPRFESQLSGTAGALSDSRRQLSIGAVCGAGTVIGFDFARLGDTALSTSTDRFDPTYGTVATSHSSRVRRMFRGASIERPLTKGALRFSAVVLLGEYRADSTWSQHSYIKDFLTGADWRTFFTSYPDSSVLVTSHAFGGGVGLKASLPIGPQFSLGFASRWHQIGSARQHFESGMTISFRP